MYNTCYYYVLIQTPKRESRNLYWNEGKVNPPSWIHVQCFFIILFYDYLFLEEGSGVLRNMDKLKMSCKGGPLTADRPGAGSEVHNGLVHGVMIYTLRASIIIQANNYDEEKYCYHCGNLAESYYYTWKWANGLNFVLSMYQLLLSQ